MTDAGVIPASTGHSPPTRNSPRGYPAGAPSRRASLHTARWLGPRLPVVTTWDREYPAICGLRRAPCAARHQPFRSDLPEGTCPSYKSGLTTAVNTPSRSRRRPGPSAIAKDDFVFGWEVLWHGVRDFTRSKPFRSADQARLESHAEHTVRDAHVRLPNVPE